MNTETKTVIYFASFRGQNSMFDRQTLMKDVIYDKNLIEDFFLWVSNRRKEIEEQNGIHVVVENMKIIR